MEIDLNFEFARLRDDPIAVKHILILVIFSMYLEFPWLCGLGKVTLRGRIFFSD
jgi:hypothetical protein